MKFLTVVSIDGPVSVVNRYRPAAIRGLEGMRIKWSLVDDRESEYRYLARERLYFAELDSEQFSSVVGCYGGRFEGECGFLGFPGATPWYGMATTFYFAGDGMLGYEEAFSGVFVQPIPEPVREPEQHTEAYESRAWHRIEKVLRNL